jgi:hypothetical protein
VQYNRTRLDLDCQIRRKPETPLGTPFIVTIKNGIAQASKERDRVVSRGWWKLAEAA